jgi:uncharacterized DUF497 family protein
VEYVWDPAKREANLEKHGLDLANGVELFDGRPVYIYASPRGDETRSVSVGLIDGRWVALVWVERDGSIRLISMRRARRAERRELGQNDV